MDELKCEKSFITVAKQLLAEVRKCSPENGGISDDMLSMLNCVFHPCLSSALDLVDKNSVTYIKCPSGRDMYEVKGSTPHPYKVLLTSNYCTCPAYCYTVLNKKTLLCKHVMSAYIAQATGKVRVITLTDEEFSKNLLNYPEN